MALRLERYGITRVRPLQGGLNLWRQRQYPVDTVDANTAALATAPSPPRTRAGEDAAIVASEAPDPSRPRGAR